MTMTVRCVHCNQPLVQDNHGTWVDPTGGDVCGVRDATSGTGLPHLVVTEQDKKPTVATPMQPLYRDDHGTIRFKPNALVRYLLAVSPHTLNDLAKLPNIPAEDWQQLAQLIGYSLDGYGDLSYVTDEAFAAAEDARDADRSLLAHADNDGDALCKAKDAEYFTDKANDVTCHDCLIIINDDRDPDYERAVQRARDNDYEDTDGKDWS